MTNSLEKVEREGFFYLNVGADPGGAGFDHTYLFDNLDDVENTIYEIFSDLEMCLGYGMYVDMQVITKEKIFPRINILPCIHLEFNLPSLKLSIHLPDDKTRNQTKDDEKRNQTEDDDETKNETQEEIRSNSFPPKIKSRIDSAEEEWSGGVGEIEISPHEEMMQINRKIFQVLNFLPKDLCNIVFTYCKSEVILRVNFNKLDFPRSLVFPSSTSKKIYLQHLDNDTCCEVVGYSLEKTEKYFHEYEFGANF